MTGLDIEESLSFLDLCQKMNKKLWLRQVIIPNINDNENYIMSLKKFIKPLKNIEKIELLPYHTLGVNKYEQLGIKYKLKGVKPMDKDKCKELELMLSDNSNLKILNK